MTRTNYNLKCRRIQFNLSRALLQLHVDNVSYVREWFYKNNSLQMFREIDRQ